MSDEMGFLSDLYSPEGIEDALSKGWENFQWALSQPKRGIDYLTSALGQLGTTPIDISQGKLDVGPVSDPFAQMKLSPSGEVSVPTVGEQATAPLEKGFIKSAVKGVTDIATDPLADLMMAGGGPVSHGVGLAMTPGFIKGTSEQAGNLVSLLHDQGKGLEDPEVRSALGEFLPTALMAGLGTKGVLEEGASLARALPEVKFGETGYSTKSPINLERSLPVNPQPILGTAMTEGGVGESAPSDTSRGSQVKDIEHLTANEYLESEGSPIRFLDVPGEELDFTKSGLETKPVPIENSTGIHPDIEALGLRPVESETLDFSEPKPIEIGDIIDKVARGLGYKDLPTTESKIVEEGAPDHLGAFKKVLEARGGEIFPQEQAILKDLEEGKTDQLNAWLDTQLRGQRHRTGVTTTEIKTTPAEEMPFVEATLAPPRGEELAAKQAELLSQAGEDPDLVAARDAVVSSMFKPVEPIEPESKPVSLAGEVSKVIPGKTPPQKNYTVTLDDGSTHTIRAENPGEAADKARKVLESYKSEKTVVNVKEKLSSLEAAAALPTSPRELKALEDIGKAQTKEELAQRLAEDRKARGLDREQVRLTDKITKAQNREELANKSYQVTLDNGSTHTIRARNEESARNFAQGILDRGTTGRKIARIEEKASSLEREAGLGGPGQPPKPPTGKGGKGFGEGGPKSPEQTLADSITDLPKTLKSAIDISFGGRQGLFFLNRGVGQKALWKGLKSGSEEAHLATQKDLANRPNAEEYKQVGLNQIRYDPTEPGSMSEQFPSRLAEKIPGVKQSQRIYDDQSNLMRADLYDAFKTKWVKEGKTLQNRPDLYKGLADYLNTLTGRKPLPEKLRAAGYILNKGFWSPQFVYSRLQMLNPAFYLKLPPEVQKMALRDVGGTIGTLGLALYSAAAVAKQEGKDASFTLDPRHTDFGKLRVGETRYDFSSGLVPIVRTAARLLTSTKTTPKGQYNLPGGFGLGRREEFKKAPFGVNAGSELGGFVEGKAAPVYQIGRGLMSGKEYPYTSVAKDYSGASFMEDLAAPMGIMDMLQAAGYNPNNLSEVPMEFWKAFLNPEGLAEGLPSLVGVGVQTYQNNKPGKSKVKTNWDNLPNPSY